MDTSLAPKHLGSNSLYDSPLYEAQYRHYREDLAFYRRLAEDYGSPILELGAGSGRVTRVLAQTGAEIVALEASATMLEQAHKNLADVSAHVHFIHGDMRRLEHLPLPYQDFALILAPFNALMHLYTLEEQDKVCADVAHLLAKQGRFAFDLYQYKAQAWGVLRREALWQDMSLDRNLEATEGSPRERQTGELFLVQEHIAETQQIQSEYYWDYLEAGQLKRHKFSLNQRYYHRYELARLLRQAGFAYKMYGGFAREPLQANSDYIVVVCGA